MTYEIESDFPVIFYNEATGESLMGCTQVINKLNKYIELEVDFEKMLLIIGILKCIHYDDMEYHSVSSDFIYQLLDMDCHQLREYYYNKCDADFDKDLEKYADKYKIVV